MKARDWGSRGRRAALLGAMLLAGWSTAQGGPTLAAVAADCAPVAHRTGGAPVALDRLDSVAAAGPGNVWAVGQSYRY